MTSFFDVDEESSRAERLIEERQEEEWHERRYQRKQFVEPSDKSTPRSMVN